MALTGDLTYLPCRCLCDIAHPDSPGICDKTPVVAIWRIATGIGMVDLLLCASCAHAAERHNLVLFRP